MKVFITWSGERSKAIAEVLRNWLPSALQVVDPYFSPDDIEKGKQWGTEIAKVLEESRIGLLCLTSENLTAPWIHFEAGAVSKAVGASKVCPILFGVRATDLAPALSLFQAAPFSKEEFLKVFRSINKELGDHMLKSDVLMDVYEMWWPRLEEKVRPHLVAKTESGVNARSNRELLEEILTSVRALTQKPSRRLASSITYPADVVRLASQIQADSLLAGPALTTSDVASLDALLRKSLAISQALSPSGRERAVEAPPSPIDCDDRVD